MTRVAAGVAWAVLGAATVAPGQTVDDIVSRYLEARGGLRQLQGVHTLRMKGTMTTGPGTPVPVVIEMKRPAMMRMDMTVEGRTGTQAFDGATGWVVMPFAGITTPDRMPPEVVKEAQAQADFDGPLVDYARKGHRVDLVGRAPVNGRDAFQLAVTLKNGNRRTIYLDAETCLEVRSTGARSINGTTIDNETTLSDYRKIDGLMFPHTMETGVANMPEKQRVVIESIEINVPLDDARFRMPR